MWYKNTIIVQQNEFFYSQDTKSGHNSNKEDRTKYFFEGQLGAWFSSLEKNEPKIGDNRWIYETEFCAWKVIPKSKYIYFTEYEIWWTPVQGNNTVEEIKDFYMDNMLAMTIPLSRGNDV